MDMHAQKQKKINPAGRQPSTAHDSFRSPYPFGTSLNDTNDTYSADTLPGFEMDSPVAPRFGHHFADVRVHAAAPEAIQTKLTINQPGDVYEQEAERVAEQVIQVETPASSEAPSTSQNARLGANDLFTRKEASDTSVHETASVPPLVDEVLSSGGGQPLDESTRSFMEPRFGHDFSRVRVHTDERAAESARAVNALAYTAGQDVVFGGGQYEPGTNEGKKLLAHELTHVVQQEQSTQVAHQDKQAVATQIEVHSPRGVIFRVVEGIAVADILDYERLADQIHKAIAGLGTDEEAVYRALQSLQRESAAIAQLKNVYRTKYDETLEEAIRGDFSGSELDYALQLLNIGTPTSAQAIGATPQSSVEFQTAARRIHEAVEGWGTDEEAIYAVLGPLQRNSALIEQLSSVYSNLYNESLRDRIVDEMSGSELDYALYLMGEQHMETTDISMAEATRLFNALSHATFVTAAGGREPVPFHYPVDGCYDRAYVMTNILTQMGYASEKVFAISRVSTAVSVVGGLRVPTDYAGDVPAGTQPAVEWWYHVAPVIHVRSAQSLGQPQAPSVEMVIDPSMFDHPITINEWTGRMSSNNFTRLSMEQLQAELQAHGGNYPVDKGLTFTTERNVYYPPGLPLSSPTPSEADVEHAANLPRMEVYANSARLHEVAAAIRGVLRVPPGTPVDVDTIVNAIRAAPAAIRVHLWSRFPELHAEVLSAVPDPTARQRIEDSVTQP